MTSKQTTQPKAEVRKCIRLVTEMRFYYKFASEIPEIMAGIGDEWVPESEESFECVSAIVTVAGKDLDITPEPYKAPEKSKYVYAKFTPANSCCEHSIEVMTEAQDTVRHALVTAGVKSLRFESKP